ncbi:MAG: hypothetical protein ABI874_04635 [Chloroflexota bacterium]
MRDNILMRLVFRTRYGKMDELVGLMKKNEDLAVVMRPDLFGGATQWRYLVDHGGDMFHVITEMLTTSDIFSQWNDALDEAYQQVEFKVWFNQMVTCTESGSRELWRAHVAPSDFSSAPGRVCVRNVYQARYGRADAVIAHLQKQSALAQKHGIPPLAIYSDLMGPMFTVVASRDFANLAAWEQTIQQIDALPEFSDWRRQLLSMVEIGRREFYRIV